MRYVIEIHCDNAAFEDNPNEVGDILRQLADNAAGRSSLDNMPLYDHNGNRVGIVRADPPGPPIWTLGRCSLCGGTGVVDGGVDGQECPDCMGSGNIRLFRDNRG